MRSRLTAIATTTVLAVSPVLGLAAPAAADVSTFTDRANDARRRLDIERVRVDNGQRIIVRVTFDNLRRSSGGLSVYFDTRGPDRGPEYLAAGGLGDGTDWQAVRIENWRGAKARLLLRCDIDLRVRYKLDKATYDIARGCFQGPGRIRVSAKSAGSAQRDWAPRRHRFYDWVRR